MRWNFSIWGIWIVLLAGCSSRPDPVPEPTPLPEAGQESRPKIQLNVTVQGAPGEVRPEKTPSAAKTSAVPPEPPASENRAAMQKIIAGQNKKSGSAGQRTQSVFPFSSRDGDSRPSGLEGELNDVERSYVRDIKERNTRTQQANEEKVFGGMNPLRR